MQKIVDGQIDHSDVMAASLNRHLPPPAAAEAKAGPSDSPVAATNAILSDDSFALLVTLMQTFMQLARSERDQKAGANELRVKQVQMAGEERRAAAYANFAGAVAGVATGAAVGAAGLSRTVKSSNLTTKSVQENVMRSNGTVLNSRGNQAAAITGGGSAPIRPERSITNQHGQSARIAGDRDGNTASMREVAQSQPRLMESEAANAAHQINSAQAQKLFGQGQLLNMLSSPLSGVATQGAGLAASEHDAKRAMLEADAELSQQRASERGDQVSQDRQRQDAALDVLRTFLRNNINAADQIVGNM
jgi:hypothetical protein